MIYIYIILGIAIYSFTLNLIYFLYNEYLYKKWLNFHKKHEYDNNMTYVRAIKNNFKRAGIKDSSEPISIPTGNFMIANTTYSMMNNLFTNDRNAFAWGYHSFLEAKGVYRSRMIKSINPFYWPIFILLLPRHIIEYLGLDTETIFTKFFQLIYWLFDSVILVIYHNDIFDFIRNDIIESVLKLFT